MHILLVLLIPILFLFLFVKVVNLRSAACRSFMGSLRPGAISTGFRFRIPFFWGIHAYPACWFTSTVPIKAGPSGAFAGLPSDCIVRWWISDAYSFGELHKRMMNVAATQISLPEIAANLKGATRELNLLHYIGEKIIIETIDDWRNKHPDMFKDAALSGDMSAIIPLIGHSLHDSYGMQIDQMQIKHSEI